MKIVVGLLELEHWICGSGFLTISKDPAVVYAPGSGKSVTDSIGDLMWKSQRSRIHRLDCRFFKDFTILGLAFGFFP
jgi:hypothetical protein